MDGRIICRQWMGVVVGALVCLTAARGQTVYTQGADLHVGGTAYVTGNASVGGDATIGDDLDVGYNIDAWWCVYAHGVVADVVAAYDAFLAAGPSAFWDDVVIDGTLDAYGKINAQGGIDPPYLLLDRQTRKEIIERVSREAPPEKLGGAALFFNADANQLETYVPAEGKFYNLSGAVVHTLPAVVAPTVQYKPWYHLDRETGQVKSVRKAVSNKYKLKAGYRLDGATGQFANTQSGQVVPREQAVEFYNAADQTYYDLQGQPLRRDQSQEQIEYTTEYRFNRETGEVEQIRRPVRTMHVLKEGFRFDKKTGQFVKEDTGEVVPKTTAVELKQTPTHTTQQP